MTAEEETASLAGNDDAAAYGDTALCAGIWASALEQHISQAEGSLWNSRTMLAAGFGSVLAAGGHILYETADLLLRIDSARSVSRKQNENFRKEAASLLEIAAMFEHVSTLEERREILVAWKQERPNDMLPELDVAFLVSITSMLDSAIGDVYSRERRTGWAKSVEQVARRLERQGSMRSL